MAIRGEPRPHRLYLLRHADAAGTGLDSRDQSRELTRTGRSQARAAGHMLADARIDLVLCSDATRTRQTAELLGISAPRRQVRRLYNAGCRQILTELTGVEDQIRTVLVVGHAPGLPSLVYMLADKYSDPAALARVRPLYPPATLTGLEFLGGWSELTSARVFMSWLADPGLGFEF